MSITDEERAALDDNYSVIPALVDDEAIAQRDAAQRAALLQALGVAQVETQLALLGATMDQVIGKLVAERNALRAVLKEIVHEFDQTYDVDCDGGHWRAPASIPAQVMERAKRLVKP